MGQLNLFLAFGAGFLSFISPCSLPLYPAFVSYITGMSVHSRTNGIGISRINAYIHTILFLLGFSIIFLALGLSTSFIGTFFAEFHDVLRQVGAILMVFFGLVLTGMLKFDFLLSTQKIHFQKRPAGYAGSILIGMGFAAGWTPCTGPILAGVLALGVSDPGRGLVYLMSYSLGFSIPFFIMTFFINRMEFLKRNSQLFMRIGGLFMIMVGILLYFNWMIKMIAWPAPLFGGFTGF